MMNRARRLSALICFLLAAADLQSADAPRQRWSEQQAAAWQQKVGWLSGCNFLPSTAINQLEMFQADTFDLQTIDRELFWARQIGFNSMRVYLQDQLWQQDAQGFLKRLDQFLGVADKHGIGIIFVLFDSCWDPFPKLGKQRAPKPHLHNSGWVQSPGAEILMDPTRHGKLRDYVVGVVSRFRDDCRVQAWDVWNEPDNMNRPAYVEKEPANKVELVLPLLKNAFVWAREANPSQPLTSAVWIGTWPDPDKLNPTEQVQINESDVISFHNYNDIASLKEAIKNLKRYNRPILCTEYMSRGNGSFFEPHLGYMKSQGVSAINWGLVSGKSQTIYPWDSWTKQYTAEPELWFHDIFRPDGRPYRAEETAYIRQINTSQLLFNGRDLGAFSAPHGEWLAAEGVTLEPTAGKSFVILPGEGVIVNGNGNTANLLTQNEYGDIQLHVEFCIPTNSNSGVYLQGRYEVQVFDSFGASRSDYPGVECGGIYPRWVDEQNVEGHSPSINASKPPGTWQTFDIAFRAPRFDAGGRKTQNARFLFVKHNGQLIHQDVEVKGPTRASRWNDEKPLGPLMLQGDHGPVAYRNLRVTPLTNWSHNLTSSLSRRSFSEGNLGVDGTVSRSH